MAAKKAESEKLFTLTEVSKKTGISMPTLQRYKKLYQSRIPSKGKGRSQRYLASSLDVFRQLKEENVKRRGRPRKAATAAKTRAPKAATRVPAKKTAKSKPSSKPAVRGTAAKKKAAGSLLTLTEIGKRTGISYPTLLRYVRTHLGKIPHQGSGRGRRFLPEAVAIFKSLRQQGGRGGRKAAATPKPRKVAAKPAAAAAATTDAALAKRVRELEQGQKRVLKQLQRLEKQVSKPFRVVLKR